MILGEGVLEVQFKKIPFHFGLKGQETSSLDREIKKQPLQTKGMCDVSKAPNSMIYSVT